MNVQVQIKMGTKHSLKETKMDWLSYTKALVEINKPLVITGVGSTATQALWSDWLDTKALKCNAAPW